MYKLHSCSTFTKLSAYDKHGLDAEEWFLPAIEALVQRPQQLNLEEAQEIGLERAFELTGLRGE